MKKTRIKIIVGIAIVFFAIGLCLGYGAFVKSHTFLLSGDGAFKSEYIQPVKETIKVSCDTDTSVMFTDIETGETYTIGYITKGAPGTIKLKLGRWYTVEGNGDLTVSPVNVCIE